MKTFICITFMNMKRRLFELLLCALLLCACGKPPLTPVAIAPEDMCAHCKMAISEKRFAAEFLDREGEAFKFDDLGCMVNYLKQPAGRAQPEVYFVMEYDNAQWLNARQAWLVQSAELHSPMGGNYAAFATKERAEAMAARVSGRLLNAQELIPHRP